MTDPPLERPYNPLDRVELGLSVERALLVRPLTDLGIFHLRRLPKFPGAGLYALYYAGSLECYKPIAPPRVETGEVPIYVGRAQPKGARQGALGLESTTSDPVLFERLREHANSIRKVEQHAGNINSSDLAIDDFKCRYLVVDDIWVSLGEALLIGHYRPVWNVIVDGFGNHGPGRGRGQQARPLWDTLHPGRTWAFRQPESSRTPGDIRGLITEHLRRASRPDLNAPPLIDDDVRRALASESDD